jgi:hypothetical protein
MNLCRAALGEDMEIFYPGVRSGFWPDTPVLCTLLEGHVRTHGNMHSARGIVWNDREARQWHLPDVAVPSR